MATKDRTTLKGYFEAGDTPTEGNFTDLIDSMRLKTEPIDIHDIANVSFTASALAYAANINIDIATGANYTLTLTGDAVLGIANMQTGQILTLLVKQDASGGHKITLPALSKVAFGGNGQINLSTAPNALDMISCYYDGTTYYWSVVPNFS